MVCVCLMVLSLPSCKSSRPAWTEKVESIEVGMTYVELVALMGEPEANIGRGMVNFLYILSAEHVTVISMQNDYAQEGGPLAVAVKPVVWTYDEFYEHFKYYPDDPDAWWRE